jgi:hypothetical protein
LVDELVWDKNTGEIRILGQRHAAVNMQALCNHLDSLVGIQVAEVIMHNLEFHLGKEDAARIKTEKTHAKLHEIIENLAQSNRLSGVGVTKVRLPENQLEPIEVKVTNPAVTGVSGAAKAFMFAWWTGAMTILLDKELDLKNVIYDQKMNVKKCQIIPR